MAFSTENNTLLKNVYSSGKHDKIIKTILHMPLTGFYKKGETQECILNRKEKQMVHMFYVIWVKFLIKN